jgi:hypothetical protein
MRRSRGVEENTRELRKKWKEERESLTFGVPIDR